MPRGLWPTPGGVRVTSGPELLSGRLLEAKVVVVSGVGPGLGRHIAEDSLAAGASVVLSARSGDYLAELAAELGGRYGPDRLATQRCGRGGYVVFGGGIGGQQRTGHQHRQAAKEIGFHGYGHNLNWE